MVFQIRWGSGKVTATLTRHLHLQSKYKKRIYKGIWTRTFLRSGVVQDRFLVSTKMTARSADRISFREEEDPIRGIYGFIMPFGLSLLLSPFVLEPRFQEDEPFTPFRKKRGRPWGWKRNAVDTRGKEFEAIRFIRRPFNYVWSALYILAIDLLGKSLVDDGGDGFVYGRLQISGFRTFRWCVSLTYDNLHWCSMRSAS